MEDQLDIKKLMSRVARLGVETPAQLLFLMPKKITNYQLDQTKKISEVEVGEKAFFKLKIVSSPLSMNNNSGYRATVSDGINNFSLVSFGMSYELSKVKINDLFYCIGSVSEFQGFKNVILNETVPVRKVGKIFSEYKKIPKVITSDAVSDKIKKAFPYFIEEAKSILVKNCNCHTEEELIKETNLPFKSLDLFFRALHFPLTVDEFEAAEKACKRISAFEVSSLALQKEDIIVPESAININKKYVKELIARVPYQLTPDQEIAINDIISDLSSEVPMNRLLSGDVGTGKTITYLIPAIAALKAKKRVAIIIQSFLVSSQVAREIKEMFPEIEVLLNAGKMNKKEKEEINEKINEGKTIIVGTSSTIHNMFNVKSGKKLKNFSFDVLIIDEEHKLGTKDKEILNENHTNVLKATATAIPRTLAIVSHGGIEISFLKDKPVYKSIQTMVWTEEKQKDMLNEVKRVVNLGYQCAIVYPVVGGKEEDNIYEDDPDNTSEKDKKRKIVKEVTEAAEMIEKFFPGNVACIHGKLKDNEKKKIIDELKDNKKQVLIASSVIEIGVTLPSMMMVAVMDSDRYGVVTLHQLRGRVDRNGKITKEGLQPKFIMMVRRNMTEKISERLNILVNSDDGFSVAEEDMMQRGFGELSGTRQSGSTSSIFIGVKIMPSDVTDFLEERQKEEYQFIYEK